MFSRLPTIMMLLPTALAAIATADVVLVDAGISKAPIVLPADASLATARAAGELADYIEKISGAKPEIITGAATPPPASAIWVGVQPGVASLFPGVNLDFQKPEEILIVARDRHVLVAGRDRTFGDRQTEYGTANAVYTFIEKQLNVRWLWPGELGEDVIQADTIAIAPVEHRFAPPFRERRVFKLGHGDNWNRYQRNQLDSLTVDAGHAFSEWWDKYHQTHPEYFALQPDGTRSGYPSAENAKLCETEPAVWKQWLANADVALRYNPALKVISATPGDSTSNGTCVCERCMAWDHSAGRPWTLGWKGSKKEYVALTDRFVKFWNQLAGMLKAQYPDRDLFVGGFAYGPGKPPPVEATPAINVIISYVGHFPLASDGVREREQAEWRQWAEKASNLHFRPNLFWYNGGHLGMPAIALKNTIEDFRFLAENNCIGLSFDTTPQHWATQGVQYYLMAKLAYDPLQDGRAVLADYYQRGFGAAAGDVEKYFDVMERAHALITGPHFRHSMGAQVDLIESLPGIYTAELLQTARAHLDAAVARVASGPTKYRDRVKFLVAGLDFARIQVESISTMAKVRDSRGSDKVAVKQAQALAEARDAIIDGHAGIAINPWMRTYMASRSIGRGRTMRDYFGPPSDTHLQAAGIQRHFRWTGKGRVALWSVAANWQMLDGKAWNAASDSPGQDDFVFLGDDAAADEPQTIYLDRDVTIGRMTLAATSDRRTYRIASRDDGADDHLDADSGMIYSLRLSDPIALDQTADAASSLTIDVEVTLLHMDGPVIRAASERGGRIIAIKPLRVGNRLNIAGGGEKTAGIFESRVPITTSRLILSDGGQFLINRPGGGDALVGGIFGANGSILLSRSASIRGGLAQFGAALRFRAHGSGADDVTVTIGEITRRGSVHLDAPTDGSTGRLILAVSAIYSNAGRAEAPTIHLAKHTFLDLGADQESPTQVNRAAGIHGEGGLIKSRDDARRTRPVSIIGDRNTYTGPTLIRSGTLQLTEVTIPVDGVPGAAEQAYAGHLGPGPLHIASAGVFDLNGLSQTVATLNDLDGTGGEVRLGGGTLTIEAKEAATFAGVITGEGALIKRGPADMTLAASYVNPVGRTLRVVDGRVVFAQALTISEGRLELAGGRIETPHLDTTRQTWHVALSDAAKAHPLITARDADIADSRLALTLADGYKPSVGDVFTILVVSGNLGGGSAANLFGRAIQEPLQVGGVTFRLALEKSEAGDQTLRVTVISVR